MANSILNRAKLSTFAKTPEQIKFFEGLFKQAQETLPESISEANEEIGALRMGVYSKPQPNYSVRTGYGLSEQRDAAGSVLSVDLVSVAHALMAFLPKQKTLDVRAGSNVTVTRDAAGFIVSASGGGGGGGSSYFPSGW